MWETLKEFLASNQFASGGLTVVVASALTYLARHIPVRIWNFSKKWIIYSVEIDNTEEAYYYFIVWIKQNIPLKKFKRISVSTRATLTERNDECDGSVFYAPAEGNHLLKVNGKRIILIKTKEKGDKPTMWNGLIQIYQGYKILTFFWNRKWLDNLIFSLKRTTGEDKNKVSIYTSQYDDWVRLVKKNCRTIDSVFLKDDLQKTIIQDIRKFIENKEWYEKHCVPHRRGYLFYGPPGTGKSSMSLVIASELKRDLAILSLPQVEGFSQLTKLLSHAANTNKIILIEDVDRNLKGEGSDVANNKHLTFADILNAIDGVSSADHQILIITTNHKDKLDPALIRPGRIDFMAEIGYADEEQMRKMYRYFRNDDGGYEDFRKRLGNGNITPAQVQMELMR